MDATHGPLSLGGRVRIIASVTCGAPDTIVPSPRPGYSKRVVALPNVEGRSPRIRRAGSEYLWPTARAPRPRDDVLRHGLDFLRVGSLTGAGPGARTLAQRLDDILRSARDPSTPNQDRRRGEWASSRPMAPSAPTGDLGRVTRVVCLVTSADRASSVTSPSDQSAKCVLLASGSQSRTSHSGVNLIRHARAGGPSRRRAVADPRSAPAVFMPAITAEMPIAPVPCMRTARLFTRIRRALDAPKSRSAATHAG